MDRLVQSRRTRPVGAPAERGKCIGFIIVIVLIVIITIICLGRGCKNKNKVFYYIADDFLLSLPPSLRGPYRIALVFIMQGSTAKLFCTRIEDLFSIFYFNDQDTTCDAADALRTSSHHSCEGCWFILGIRGDIVRGSHRVCSELR